MTVAELIEKLEGFDPKIKVVFLVDEPDNFQRLRASNSLTSVSPTWTAYFLNACRPRGWF
jgi:hypothetical protein